MFAIPFQGLACGHTATCPYRHRAAWAGTNQQPDVHKKKEQPSTNKPKHTAVAQLTGTWATTKNQLQWPDPDYNNTREADSQPSRNFYNNNTGNQEHKTQPDNKLYPTSEQCQPGVSTVNSKDSPPPARLHHNPSHHNWHITNVIWRRYTNNGAHPNDSDFILEALIESQQTA